MITLPTNTLLLVIDVQQAFEDPKWGKRNNPGCERNIALLLKTWRSMGGPIIHIQHLNPKPESLFGPAKPGFAFKPEAVPLPGEPVLFKSVNSAFIGTDLEPRLRRMATTHLVIGGITTDHCVSTTTRMAGNLGFTVYIVADATATFDRIGPDGRHWTAAQMHDTALASLNREFAEVVNTIEVIDAVTAKDRFSPAAR